MKENNIREYYQNAFLEKIQDSPETSNLIIAENHDFPALVALTELKKVIEEIATDRKIIFLLEGLPQKFNHAPYTYSEITRRHLPVEGKEHFCLLNLFFKNLMEIGVEFHGAEQESTAINFEFEFFQRRLYSQIFQEDYLSQEEIEVKTDYVNQKNSEHYRESVKFIMTNKREYAYNLAATNYSKELLEKSPDALIITICGVEHLQGIADYMLDVHNVQQIDAPVVSKDLKVRKENSERYLCDFSESIESSQSAFYFSYEQNKHEISLLNYIDAQRSLFSPSQTKNGLEALFFKSPDFFKLKNLPADIRAAIKVVKYLQGDDGVKLKDDELAAMGTGKLADILEKTLGDIDLSIFQESKDNACSIL